MIDRLRRLLSFDIVPGQRRRHPVRWALIAVIGTAVVVLLGTAKPNPFAHPEEVRAHFRTGQHIFPNTLVRVHGVDVGKVKQVQLLPDGTLDLTMAITKKDEVTVHRDARADLYYRTLLGRNVYVELDPGSADAPPLGDAEIPMDRTTAQVEVDEVIRPLQPNAQSGTHKALATLDQGLSGTPPRQSVKLLGPALRHTATTVTTIRGQDPGVDLPKLVHGGRRALGALNSDENALAGLVDNADVALGVTAARHADLGSIVAQAPATLAETRTTMVRLRRTLDVADPIALSLRPGVRRIAPAVTAATPTMEKLRAVIPVALPALRNLQPALVSLRSLAVAGVPLMDRLQPTLVRTERQIIPFLNERDPHTRLTNYEAIGPAFATVSSSASTFDAGGFEQRFQPGGRNFGTGRPSTFPIPASCPKGSEQACQRLVAALYDGFGGVNSAPTPGPTTVPTSPGGSLP